MSRLKGIRGIKQQKGRSLTWWQARRIKKMKELKDTGEMTTKEIAELFGVYPSTVRQIWRGEIWIWA